MPLHLFLPQPKSLSLQSSHSPHNNEHLLNFGFSSRRSLANPRPRFKVFDGLKWNLNDIDRDAVQERLNIWLAKTQTFFNEVAAPLVNSGQGRKSDNENALGTVVSEDVYLAEQTIDGKTPNGNLSLAAIVSIEQFSRMNGLTAFKMQKFFESLAPELIRKDARNLVEYCCFRYLSRDTSDIHPCLKEPAFQRLIFVTMLAWQQPYGEGSVNSQKIASLQKALVGEEAFVRIAPTVSGVADRSTVHSLFKTLVGDESGISLSLWLSYVSELLKVHQGRKSCQLRKSAQLSNEKVLCIGSNRKRPVLKWDKNMAWPGKLTLTDTALYFEAIGFKGYKEPMRLDLTRNGMRVKKTRVGPFGYVFLDSAISVSSGSGSETWVLEFVDFSGEMRRDVWYAFISEVISLYGFVREFGPDDDDPAIHNVYGAHKGKARAITSAANSIARLQSLQLMRKLSEDPVKLVQFSYLRSAPFGDIVLQTLAVNFWGGPSIAKLRKEDQEPTGPEELSYASIHVFDIDGSVYLRRWMRSLSWTSSTSIAFWKNSLIRQGVILSKNLVVADMSLVERAAWTCKEKSQIVERTQATIDAAMIKGIPSNIDLVKELMLPLTVAVKNFERLRRWEEPHLTVSFLAFAYTLIFRNMLSYIFPMALIVLATTMLLLKGLKEQGRLGRFFGRVTIREQPPSNTIQKIVALKEAMADLESFLQSVNVSLLKIRTIVLSGEPQVTGEVALVLLCAATVLLLVPFRYILAFFLLDLFTRELDFRREMVMKFMSLLKERWVTVPAAPVIVLPYDNDENVSGNKTLENDQSKPEGTQNDEGSMKYR